jgi:transposase-like protein
MIEGTMPSCPKCGNTRTARRRRSGLLETLVLPRLGLYPWECNGCRTNFNYSNRGRIRRSRKPMDEMHVPAFQERELTSISALPTRQ